MSGKSGWTYERYRLGELSESERLELEAEPDFRDKMAALDESDREIFGKYPAAAMAEAIRKRAEAEDSAAGEVLADSLAEEDRTGNDAAAEDAEIRRFRPLRSLVPMAAAAALIVAAALIIMPRTGMNRGGDEPSEVLRPKGLDVPDVPIAPELVLYRDGPDGAETLESGDLAVEHDLLQVGYLGGGNWWGVIVSVDGNGMVTRHWPAGGDEAVPLEGGGETLLPYAYELDDAPDFEAFALIWSEKPFSAAAAESLMKDYRRGGPEPDAKDLNPAGKSGVTVITIRKSP